ncbi:MAG: site-specific integrase [Rhodocyclaceae bacterium]|nr:site-specific integrase [Rhodocyclaceae bacterium]MCA3061784.1 site-specific integrase [Rhodocyclaceae bacterium]
MKKNRKAPKRRGALSLAKKVTAAVTMHGVPRKLLPNSVTIKIAGVGTERTTRGCVKRYIEWQRAVLHKDWSETSLSNVIAYLNERAEVVAQATLDVDRLALQRVLRFEIPFVVSKVPTVLAPRAYQPLHVGVLCKFANTELAFSIGLAANGGLRAAELLSLAPADLVAEDRRPWHEDRFAGREDAFELFTVSGKGGLKRGVAIPKILALRLHQKRLAAPRSFVDREVRGVQYFDLLGGHRFSHYFSQHSTSLLGFSSGAHGLRHYFAQRRLVELQKAGLTGPEALQVLANELGHFSVTNTRKYLR